MSHTQDAQGAVGRGRLPFQEDWDGASTSWRESPSDPGQCWGPPSYDGQRAKSKALPAGGPTDAWGLDELHPNPLAARMLLSEKTHQGSRTLLPG